MSPPYIAVYEGNGGWRWAYRDDEADLELHGNQDFASAADASAAASLAYPDVPVTTDERAEAVRDEHERARLFLELVGGILAAVGLIVLLRWLASLEADP